MRVQVENDFERLRCSYTPRSVSLAARFLVATSSDSLLDLLVALDFSAGRTSALTLAMPHGQPSSGEAERNSDGKLPLRIHALA